MKKPVLVRERIIPNEKVYLLDDEILSFDNERIVTKWKTLKPRTDFNNGISCYFLKDGFKLSKFMKDDECIYYYFDITESILDTKSNTYFIKDLLIDIVVYKNGFVKVLDLDELSQAFNENLIDSLTLQKALNTANYLLNSIYDDKFNEISKYLEV